MRGNRRRALWPRLCSTRRGRATARPPPRGTLPAQVERPRVRDARCFVRAGPGTDADGGPARSSSFQSFGHSIAYGGPLNNWFKERAAGEAGADATHYFAAEITTFPNLSSIGGRSLPFSPPRLRPAPPMQCRTIQRLPGGEFSIGWAQEAWSVEWDGTRPRALAAGDRPFSKPR